tara:strand:+ start:1639 stop:1926 length:288 start_codon:yes stop_codon:yes gene_type:complete
MTYFDCDISNDGFIKNPEIKEYLNSVRPINSFVKSASCITAHSVSLEKYYYEKANQLSRMKPVFLISPLILFSGRFIYLVFVLCPLNTLLKLAET